MEFAFEVRETDLMGRIGRLKVGGKVLETPCLFPVIHPVRQAVTTAELEAMGFRGLMTNSYIMMSRRRDEALAKGIHRTLGFDGVFMTDSGGYQVLEYGDLEVGYRSVASFQEAVGSELSVTLDRPTGYSASEAYARSTVEYSIRNAAATMREYGQGKTVWVGPVQGGLYPELVSKSAAALTKAGFGFLALGSPVQVMENYRFSELASMVMAAKKAAPYSVPLHLFGAGHPLTMAMAVALGCDTFDSASYILFARGGRYMTERGVSHLDAMEFLPCSCPVCSRATAAGLRELGADERTRALSVHNLHVLRKEVETCKEAIAEGRLWDLVREKATAHPRLFDALGGLESAGVMLQEGTPLLKGRGLFVRDGLDAARPELAAAANRLKRSARRGSDRAVLVVSGTPLPLSRVPVSRRKALSGADLYRLHPTLGPYPAELEFVYPFTQTEAGERVSLKPSDGARALRRMGYAKVSVVVAESRDRRRPGGPRSRRRPRGSSPSPR